MKFLDHSLTKIYSISFRTSTKKLFISSDPDPLEHPKAQVDNTQDTPVAEKYKEIDVIPKYQKPIMISEKKHTEDLRAPKSLFDKKIIGNKHRFTIQHFYPLLL